MALPFSYHWRNLFVRKTTTVLTVLVVAAVVGVLTWIMGLAAALHASLAMASEESKLIVIKRGATAEGNSAIPVDEYNNLSQLTDVAREPRTDEPLLSPEMVVQVSRPRLRDRGKTWGNLALRGVTETAFKVHRNVKPLGRVFSTGAPEVIVGLSAAQQFAGLGIGDTIDLGSGNNRTYTVVGHFSADGGPAESELWGYLPSLMNAYNRTMYSSAALRLREGADAKRVIQQIEGPAIQLSGQTEAQYWQAQSSTIRTYLGIAYILVGAMSLAAVFSIANTMFSTVAGRTREVAMLRTIGFSGRQIVSGFILESVFLSLLGGVLGCMACIAWLAVIGNTKDMFGASTFTTLAFEIHVTGFTVAAALVNVTLVGVIGSLVPAVRAARVGVVSALREP